MSLQQSPLTVHDWPAGLQQMSTSHLPWQQSESRAQLGLAFRLL
jgi:hypothetical protein